jgi:hypothetical protein
MSNRNALIISSDMVVLRSLLFVFDVENATDEARKEYIGSKVLTRTLSCRSCLTACLSRIFWRFKFMSASGLSKRSRFI